MANINKILWTEADVRCPFYISDDKTGRSICCEGFGAGTDSISRFRTTTLMDRHMGRYCVSDFERCPVYGCTYACKYRDT